MAAFLRGLWVVVRALAFAVVLLALFVAGRPATVNATGNRMLSGAGYLHAGRRVVPARLNVHWYAWPGWQRTLTRLFLVALAVLTVRWPLPTAIGTAGTTGALMLTAAAVRHRRQQSSIGPRKVRVQVGPGRQVGQ